MEGFSSSQVLAAHSTHLAVCPSSPRIGPETDRRPHLNALRPFIRRKPSFNVWTAWPFLITLTPDTAAPSASDVFASRRGYTL
ncbi:unnamed protein product [Arctogadus glacialis]